MDFSTKRNREEIYHLSAQSRSSKVTCWRAGIVANGFPSSVAGEEFPQEAWERGPLRNQTLLMANIPFVMSADSVNLEETWMDGGGEVKSNCIKE